MAFSLHSFTVSNDSFSSDLKPANTEYAGEPNIVTLFLGLRHLHYNGKQERIRTGGLSKSV